MSNVRFSFRVVIILFLSLIVCPFQFNAFAKAQRKGTAANTFESPDFAYPRKVIENALPVLERSKASGRNIDVVRALVQLTVAEDAISVSAMPRMAHTIDSLANNAEGAIASILRMLEARLYVEVYASNPGTFKSRDLPLDSFPDDPTLWSADMFALKIHELVSSAMTDRGMLASEPVDAWAALFTGLDKVSTPFYPNLYAVLAPIATRMLDRFSYGRQPIPFTSVGGYLSPTQKCIALRDKISSINTSLAYDSGNVAWLAAALPKSISSLDDKDAYSKLVDAYDRYKTSPYAGEFLVNAAAYDDYLRETPASGALLRAMLREAIDSHPDYERVNALKNALSAFDLPRCHISMPGEVLPSGNFLMKVERSGSSMPLYIQIFRIEGNQRDVSKFLRSGGGKRVASYKIESDTCTLSCEPLPAGQYAVAPSSSSAEDRSALLLHDYPIIFRSSALQAFYAGSTDGSGDGRLYIVDAADGTPLKDVRVVFARNDYRKQPTEFKAVTNREGWVKVPAPDKDYNAVTFTATRNGDSLSGYLYSYIDNSRRNSTDVQIFPSLAMYKPGSKCEFAIVAYEVKKYINHLLPSAAVDIKLFNASGEQADSLRVITDESGRASAAFDLPKEGMLGDFRIVAYSEAGMVLGATTIKVEEYRQPGFFVELETKRSYYASGDTVTLSGSVMSYSGMPMPGAKVSINIDYVRPWWRYRSVSDGSYATEVSTDASGEFNLSLPTSALAGTPFASGTFEVTASATSSAGETQQSELTRFYLGNLARVTVMSPELICADGEKIRFSAAVEGVSGDSVVDYMLKDISGNIVSSGTIPSDGLELDASRFPSGKYSLSVNLQGDPGVSDSATVVIYRSEDTRPPIDTPLWVPKQRIVAQERERKVKVPVGSYGACQTVICVISDREHIISSSAIEIEDRNTHVEVPVPARGNTTFVRFFTVRNVETREEMVTVCPPAEALEMEVKSFRDHIMAGGKERWTFTYKAIGPDNTAASIPVIATLSDKALNAITPFSWQWGIYRNNMPGAQYKTFATGSRSNTYMLSAYKPLTVPGILVPALDTYNQALYPAAYVAQRMLYATATADMAAPAAGNAAHKEALRVRGGAQESVAEEDAVVEEAVEAGAPEASAEETQRFRPAEMPLAWFRPALSTDAEGNLEISFDTPDFNTTWQLQLMAYNPALSICHSTLTTVASKPVMVQAVSPRFLRTGDDATLSATIFNNTDEEALMEAEIVIFDPLTQATVLSVHFAPEKVDAKGNKVISVPFRVPDNLQFIGYRVSAKSGTYSDGEQNLISILPSSSPVIESYPFYVAPGEQTISIDVPALSPSSMVTLQYCDNPVWYCVTALPDLTMPKDAGILSLVNSLYGNAIAVGLTHRYPQLGEALAQWRESGDSTLVSALSRSPELKTVALSSTPWVANASSETLRMQQLVGLLDATKADEAITAAVKDLLDRQNRDGGWSWCPGMESSVFITEQVLSRLAALRGMGFSPSASSLAKAEKKAIAYVEKEIVADYKKNKDYDPERLLDWLYVRSFYTSIAPSTAMAPIKKKALDRIATGWKHYDIGDAATAAILLCREGKKNVAAEILESLSQRASYSVERGMWYDNLRSSWTSYGPLYVTARVLQAFAEADPSSPSIDKLRQWLLLERQAQDWGSDSRLAEVINGILCNSTWTAASSPAEIRMNGTLLKADRMDHLTGAFTMPLDAEQASGAKITVVRSGSGPAWGGVATRRIAPIETIKDFSMSDVSVTKRLLVVEEDSTGTHTRLAGSEPVKQGSKVRVQLTVTSAREIDYAVITDEQAACLAPVDQLSGYKSRGEVFYYREVKQGVTNLFIPHLPKGKFLVEYDCYVEGDGSYAAGIATIQSLYAPMLSAHSGGMEIKVAR